MDSVSDIASICSLTPSSVVNSPENSHKKFVITGTPENSPICSRSPSPQRQENDQDTVGYFINI